MPLTLILGPMKSGKSRILIEHFLGLEKTNTPFALFQSALNVRDEKIRSRDGIEMDGKKVHTLAEALKLDVRAVGIDEIHMFDEQEADIIARLLERSIEVVAAGLPTDYRGQMFAIVRRLLELKTIEMRYHHAVCEVCRIPKAVYTQVLRGDIPMTDGLPPSLPEDGTYLYKPVCGRCFVKK